MKINVKFVSLSSDLIPKIIVDKRSDVVRYGDDNELPKKLLDLSTQGSLHSSIINKKTKLLCGNGLTYVEDSNTKMEEFLKNPNPYETFNDILQKIANDVEIFGGFSLQTIWTRDKSKISEIYHQPFHTIRSSKVNNKNIVEKYYLHDEWKKYTRYNDAESIERFQSNNKTKPQLLYAKKYTTSNLYYPLPSYIGGINDISTMNEISIFHNSCVKNNFQPGMMIVFRGPLPTEEEQDAIVEKMKQKYSGSINAGTPTIFFLDSDQEEPKLQQTDTSNLYKQYDTLTKSIKESVVMAHEIPPILASLQTSGSLGGGKEYIESHELFHTEYVSTNQHFILDNLNKIMDINGLPHLNILNPKPSILFYSESLIKDVLDRNELRTLFGYDTIDDNKNNNMNNE